MAILALSAATFNAQAQGFVEFGIGQSKVDIDASGLGGLSVSKDEKDTAWSISGGYMFHPMIGAEIGYRNLGEASLSATDGIDTARASIEVDGFTIGAVGRIPVGEKFAIVPRAGLYLWDASGKGTFNGAQVTSLDDDGSD
ncbi:MAG TPA: outer membrane beta-barrel protein, partial [Burkholderiales bacterium]|nr:outer membrane beta-barrel protein [Burkholderiales bacterium]